VKRATGATRRAARGGILAPVRPDAALARVVGDEEQPRSEVIKRLWSYIKERGLQDPRDRRMINADETLGQVLNGKRKVSMFEMTKLVNQHLNSP
jgi:chromatin remodeling complex protein RSC6